MIKIRTGHTRYFLSRVEIKDYNVMIHRQNFFDQPLKNDIITYGNIQKIVRGQGDDYTTDFLLDYFYLKEYYKMIAIDLHEKQELDAEPTAIQQINFIGNLERGRDTQMFFIPEEKKGLFWESILNLFSFHLISI